MPLITAAGEAHLAVADAVDARVVDGEEDGFEPRGFDLVQLRLQPGLVRPDILLVEHDLSGGGGGANGLGGLRAGYRGHVEDAGSARGLDEVGLGSGVCATCLRGRGYEEGRGEVVAEDGSPRETDSVLVLNILSRESAILQVHIRNVCEAEPVEP